MKTGSLIAFVFLFLFCVFHLLRLILGWAVVIGGASIPAWASIVAFLVAGAIAVMLWREGKKSS